VDLFDVLEVFEVRELFVVLFTGIFTP